VTTQREESRAAGAIGSSLQAEVVGGAAGEDLELLRSLGDDLKFVLITSKAAVRPADAGEPTVTVTASAARKCERCWHWREDVGADRRHETICARCVSNLEGPGEVRRHA
jgi:isoleucyl-tRNA synthetase